MGGISGSDDLSDAGQTSPQADEEFLVVGIGASAGGIGALKNFFAQVPEDSGMAYVVILHLSPDHESQLAEVLQFSAAIPVTQVAGAVKIVPDHVYVVPPNRSLTMIEGHLTLSDITRIEERRAPIDIFFRTLAESKKSRAVSIVLSGTGADGSMGLKRVKEMGGICGAQEPDEAEYGDMPSNAVATGLIDFVLPAAALPAKIIAYKERLDQTILPTQSLDLAEVDEAALRDIFTQLRVQTGHDFSNYKRSTVMRRIERRIKVHELADLPAYSSFLSEHQKESQSLLKDLLISVTNFFRDREVFASLERKIIPKLFEGKGADDQVRVWVSGCATGEEAYSVAMLLCEYSATIVEAPEVQVFATDIDEAAIAAAREGMYTLNDVADVSPERLQRFFIIAGRKGYRVCNELRETVLFARHNAIKDPPFTRLDLVTCRNLLIYLNRRAQERVMEVIHFAVNPGGYLLLGTSESLEGRGELYLPFDKEAHLYRRNDAIPRMARPIADLSLSARDKLRTNAGRLNVHSAPARLPYSDLHQRVLERYAPPSVLVNEEYEVVHLSERAGRYLQPAGGTFSLDLVRMVRPELRPYLRTAFRQASLTHSSVEARGIAVQFEDCTRLVNLIVRPAMREEGHEERGLILVLFEETGEGAEAASLPQAEVIRRGEQAVSLLEDEMVGLKAASRASTEDYETQTEELRAANEELQAMNEELRTGAEELETGKEELQSINEELQTVNQELKHKFEELRRANNDIQNLMSSTQIGTIFLDSALRVKLFTPSIIDVFNLRRSDIGRPLSDFTGRLIYDELLADLKHVAESSQTIERELKTHEGRWYLLRAFPYRTTEESADGIVLTFINITERKQAEQRKAIQY